MSNEENNEQRQPRDLQGLLRFALNATRAEDAPNESHYQQMDPERRQFLENALKAFTIDVIQELETAAEKLTSTTSSEDEKLEALETIMDYVDNIDTANDFCKIGGLSVLVPCLDSEYAKIRAKSASLVGELAQNNPYCQKQLLEADALPKLIDLLKEKETATNAIHAISCLVRAYEPCSAAFIEIGGLECLLGCLQQTDQEKLIVRSLFLLNSLCTDYPPIRDELIKLGGVEQIISILRPVEGYDTRLETILSTLCLLTDNTDAVVRCQSADLSLRESLTEIIRTSAEKPECQETVEYCHILLDKVYSSRRNSTDR